MAKKKQIQLTSTNFNPAHCAGHFSVNSLEPQDGFSAIYEYELLTAEEKAEYYEDLVKNGGRENSEKIAKDCRRRAELLRQRAERLGSDSQHLALPLIEHAQRLENLAFYHENPDDPEILSAQKEPLNPDETDIHFPDGEDAVTSEGRPNLEPIVKMSDKTDRGGSENLKRAKFWRQIYEWNKNETVAYYFCKPTKPADWKEAMFVRAQKDPVALKLIASGADYAVGRLLELAQMGNQDAAKIAVEQIEKLVRTLNLYAKTDPKIFSQTAGTMASWPVIASPHPKLYESAKSIMGTLGVGQAYPFIIDGSSEWIPRRPAHKIAIHLYKYLEKIRLHPEHHQDIYAGTGQPGMSGDEGLPIHEAAAKLPNIKETGAVRKWWAVGRRILLCSYPDPKSDPHLRSLTGLKKASKVNSKILETLGNAFKSLFPKEFY